MRPDLRSRSRTGGASRAGSIRLPASLRRNPRSPTWRGNGPAHKEALQDETQKRTGVADLRSFSVHLVAIFLKFPKAIPKTKNSAQAEECQEVTVSWRRIKLHCSLKPMFSKLGLKSTSQSFTGGIVLRSEENKGLMPAGGGKLPSGPMRHHVQKLGRSQEARQHHPPAAEAEGVGKKRMTYAG
jgi:hypothetical protein